MASLWPWLASSTGTRRWYGLTSALDYGEVRMVALAPRDEILYYVAFVDRDEVLRIISLRRANHREVRHYVKTV